MKIGFRSIATALCVAALALAATAAPGQANAATAYDNLIQVSPSLYVYTDGAAKAHTMDISATWWSDFQAAYAQRVTQNIGWPTDFVSRFQDIMTSGGSWGIFMRETGFGDTITLIGTHDPNATCTFSGLTSNDGFDCSANASYDSVEADYFTHSSYGGNGCVGSGMNICSPDGMAIYSAPTIRTSGGGSWGFGIPDLPQYKFFVMHFNVQYPAGYQGAQIPSALPGADSQYVAMGDSFSSGEGNAPYLPGSDAPMPGTSGSPVQMDGCHRSAAAYSQVLSSELSGLHEPDFVACSGAVTADLYNGNHTPNLIPNPTGGYAAEAAQMNALSTKTKLVTLTIGGNDLGFAGIMGQCIAVAAGADPHCQGSPEAQLLPARLAALSNSSDQPSGTLGADGTHIYGWQKIIRDIHAKAPNATIAVAGYPQLIDPKGSKFGEVGRNECLVGLDVPNGGGTPGPPGNFGVDLNIYKDEANWISAQITTVNAAIKTAVQGVPGTNAIYIPVESTFNGHALCDADPWIYSISASGAFSTDLTFKWPGSLHPTADGQSKGYAAAFAAALPNTF